MSKLQFSTIFFDLGNTLIYFDGDWTETAIRAQAAIAQSLTRHGFKVDETEFGLQFNKAIQQYAQDRRNDLLEPTTSCVLKKTLKEFAIESISDEIFATLLKDYYAVSEERWKLPEDTHPTLEKLKKMGLQIALISNAADADNVHRQIKSADLEPYLDLFLISAEVGIRKPGKEIFQKALDHFQVEPAKVVMVGDLLEADIQGARNAGIASVWLTRWAHNPENEACIKRIKPLAKIRRLRELPRLLENWKYK
jgi:putative hydrolase of the HAD superfamily